MCVSHVKPENNQENVWQVSGVCSREKPEVCPTHPFAKLVLITAWRSLGSMLMGFTYLMNVISERKHTTDGLGCTICWDMMK